MGPTPLQKEAIETTDKSLVVTAGAGAGKTRILVGRIIYILQQGLASIDEIAAITYTNKAALEMRERLRCEMKMQKCDDSISKNLLRLSTAYIGTIHSFCLRLLKENPVEASIDPEAQVAKEYQANAWLKESIQEAIIGKLENKNVFQITAEMGFAKLSDELYQNIIKMQNQGVSITALSEMATCEDEKTIVMLIKESLKIYGSKKEKQHVLDYEDILEKTLDMFEKNREILKNYQKKFKFILVDEYQDLNFIQDKILRLLGKDTNLFVVGDKKQSIYGFRGARVELFEKLRKDLEKNGKSLSLKDNFRSNDKIITFVNKAFENIMENYEPINYKRQHDGKNICFLIGENSGLMRERRQLEARLIADKILEMLSDDSVKVYDSTTGGYRRPTFRDFAVLFRRKTHLSCYIDEFRARNIPFYVAEVGTLKESRGVKNLLLGLKAVEYKDDINIYGSLSRLLKVDDDKIAEYVLNGKKLSNIFDENIDSGEAFKLFQMWVRIKDKATIKYLAQQIIKDSKLLYTDLEDVLDAESLFRFLDLCAVYDEEGFTLREFLEELSNWGSEYQEAVDVSEEEDVVKFITIHSAKGLEFPIVILADSGQSLSTVSSEILFDPEIGLAIKKDKEKWQELKSFLDNKEIEEAKRLLYVALTRAMDYLVISGEITSDKRESFLKWLSQTTS